MGVRPPFLFDAEPAPVTVLRVIDDDLAIVDVRGQWTACCEDRPRPAGWSHAPVPPGAARFGIPRPARRLELVSNVVEHVGGPSRLMLARRGNGLHMTVADRSRVMPRTGGRVPRHTAPVLSEGGRGLQLIHSIAVAWGAMPIEGGKVVWAILR
ncbi:hypothetical protein ACTI_42010 [Actinoplanes sp. OR16]|uniref:ATP-binding protein n=1 Tax=Actinoplanes sp. OR16 TaxID=946334 RepID=UPI000F71E792|nr:ATP-binding protein [Actinoplanes sp. OR16]BBH67516.1 hypothetical protein ACTI_42010 [Actinoplanes sp. OR16]